MGDRGRQRFSPGRVELTGILLPADLVPYLTDVMCRFWQSRVWKSSRGSCLQENNSRPTKYGSRILSSNGKSDARDLVPTLVWHGPAPRVDRKPFPYGSAYELESKVSPCRPTYCAGCERLGGMPYPSDTRQRRDTCTHSRCGVNTAFIERLNTTFRQRISALVRRTRNLAQQAETLITCMYLVG